MEKYSYEWPKGMMDGYVRILLDNFCSWGKCFQGYGGCGSRLPVFSRCEKWSVPKILKEIRKTLIQNPEAKFFLDTPNFFDSSIKLNEFGLNQFENLLAMISRTKLNPYLSIQTSPQDIVYNVKRFHYIFTDDLRRAGIKEIWLGVESANSKLRDKYSKPRFSNTDLEEAIIMLHKAEINCCFYLTVSSDDTDETIQETVNFVHRTKPVKICPFDAFHYTSGEHYVDWNNMRANLEKIARYQKVLRDLAEEVNCKS